MEVIEGIASSIYETLIILIIYIHIGKDINRYKVNNRYKVQGPAVQSIVSLTSPLVVR